MTDPSRLPRGLVALLEGAIDYAGLFPPAGLAMADAAERFDRYARSPRAWALGRYVVPASRLDELERAVNLLEPRHPGAESREPKAESRKPIWSLSVLAGLPLDADASAVERFNVEHARADARWPARIDSVEVKATSPEEIRQAAGCLPTGVDLFFEIPLDGDLDAVCGAAAASGRFLKFRTGGTAVGSVPPSAAVARALQACASARVPFKLTAGLHHPVRSAHPLTYDAGAPTATMHGFVNVLVAACLLASGCIEAREAVQVLEDEVARSFVFDEDSASWRGRRLGLTEIGAARRLARGFGSCSFEEPLDEISSGVVSENGPRE